MTKYEKISEPVAVGEFVIRRELYEITPDPNFKPQTFNIYQGSEIALLVEGRVDRVDETPLRRREDLWAGRTIVATTLVGRCVATVVADEQGRLWWETPGVFGDLQFDTDDRHCWITTMAMNRRGLKSYG